MTIYNPDLDAEVGGLELELLKDVTEGELTKRGLSSVDAEITARFSGTSYRVLVGWPNGRTLSLCYDADDSRLA